MLSITLPLSGDGVISRMWAETATNDHERGELSLFGRILMRMNQVIYVPPWNNAFITDSIIPLRRGRNPPSEQISEIRP